MLKPSLRSLVARLPFLLPSLMATAFVFLYPMGDDVAFSRPGGSRNTLRFTRSGMDRVISLPIRFHRIEKSWLPPLPNFHWDDIMRTAAFRKNLPQLYTRAGMPRTPFQFFATYINVSTAQGLKNRTFYFNFQYRSADFKREAGHNLVRRAATSFCAILSRKKIQCSPSGIPVLRRAGNPVWTVVAAFSKILLVLVPLLLGHYLLLLLRKRYPISVFPAILITTLLFAAYFLLHLLLHGRIFIPSLILLAGLLFFVLYRYRDRLRTVTTVSAAAAGTGGLLFLLLLSIQAESVLFPQFHTMSTMDSRITQRITLRFEDTKRKPSPYPWHALPESTLFMKKILMKEAGMRSARMLRVYLANPQYRCFLKGIRTGEKPSATFVMEFNRKEISSGGKRKIPDTYFLSMFRYFRESYARFIADLGGTIHTAGEPSPDNDLPAVPYPLRTRALFALLAAALILIAVCSLGKPERS